MTAANQNSFLVEWFASVVLSTPVRLTCVLLRFISKRHIVGRLCNVINLILQ